MAIVQKNQIIFRFIKPTCYAKYAFLDEHMDKLKRGHGILIAQLDEFGDKLVAIPLRSKLNPKFKDKKIRYIVPFETYEIEGEEYLKGLDISKLLLVDEVDVDLVSNFDLDGREKEYYLENKNKIFTRTVNYINSYVKNCNTHEAVIKEILSNEKKEYSELPKGLQRFILNYQYSTLRNYHSDFDIDVLSIKEIRDFMKLYSR
ncbi:hypothetical protein ACM6P1_11995 [Enterococcus faecium]|uniref:hypothetical protein n=1 Tax=Enterococcus TaxID=1350 RepID=UPI003391D68B